MAEAEATTGGATPFAGALADLRGSLKWLVGASGATAAVIVAGLQLTSIDTESPVAAVVAIVSAGLAVAIVLALLVAAARVLTTRRLTASELSDREIASGAFPPSISAGSDPLVNRILDQRVYLLGSAETVTDLFIDQYSGVLNALRDLDEGRSVKWHGKTIAAPGSDADRSSMQAAVEVAQQRLHSVEEAAHFFATDERYRRLFGKRFVLGAVGFIAAIVTFAVTTATPAAAPTPRNVQIFVVDRERSSLPATCTETSLAGVELSGSLETPKLAVRPKGSCPAMMIESAEGLVLVPEIK